MTLPKTYGPAAFCWLVSVVLFAEGVEFPNEKLKPLFTVGGTTSFSKLKGFDWNEKLKDEVLDAEVAALDNGFDAKEKPDVGKVSDDVDTTVDLAKNDKPTDGSGADSIADFGANEKPKLEDEVAAVAVVVADFTPNEFPIKLDVDTTIFSFWSFVFNTPFPNVPKKFFISKMFNI